MGHWIKILADETIDKKTVLYEGRVAGHVVSFEWSGKREVGYWIGKEYWGKGIATQALSEFLPLVWERPLYAWVAKHNLASIRVLQKCGFTIADEDSGSYDGSGEEVEGYILTLAEKEK